MKKKRFSVEQITGILKQAELGAPIAELCRQHGISEQSYYRWKKIYGGMKPSEGRTACRSFRFGAGATTRDTEDRRRRLEHRRLEFGSPGGRPAQRRSPLLPASPAARADGPRAPRGGNDSAREGKETGPSTGGRPGYVIAHWKGRVRTLQRHRHHSFAAVQEQ